MNITAKVQALPVPEKVNSFWHLHNPASPTVVVFVHGILSTSQGCWRAKSGVYWPTLLSNDNRVSQPSIYLAGYATNAGSGDLRIHDCASELLRDLKLPDGAGRPAPISSPSIVFVCHSTGGIVVRYMLERNQPEFVRKRIGLVLMASPSLGSAEADNLSALLWFYNQQLGQQLATGSASLFDIDNRFRDVVNKRRLELVGIEAYEHYFVTRGLLPERLRNWLPNWGRRVVQPFSAGVYFGAPQLMSGTDHFTIVKPTADTHPSHKLLVEFLQEFAAAPSAPQPSAPEPPMLPLPMKKSSEAWATLKRTRQEPDTEPSKALRARTTDRTVIIRRPDAISTEIDDLLNVTDKAQNVCKFGLFTDSPSQFKDLQFRAQVKIGDVELEPAVSAEETGGGHKFLITLEFKGQVVKAGASMTLRYDARLPSSVALNEDYWVFPAEKMLPGGRLTFRVKFPKEPANVTCYRIALDDAIEPTEVSGPVREGGEGSQEELFVYEATPENPVGNSFVMTWRLE